MCDGGWSVWTHSISSITLENPANTGSIAPQQWEKTLRQDQQLSFLYSTVLLGKQSSVTKFLVCEVFLQPTTLQEEANSSEGLQQYEGAWRPQGTGLLGRGESHYLDENHGNERSCFYGLEKLQGLELHFKSRLYFKSQVLV